MTKIREDIREEIRMKQEALDYDPRSYETRLRQIRDDLTRMGDVYSFWIEHPDLRRDLLLDKKSPKTIRKMARDGIRNIKNAWYGLTNFGRDMDFHLVLNPDILKRTNALVIGVPARNGGYRTRDVSLGFAHYIPPNPKKISEKIEQTLEHFTDLHRRDPVEAAIYLHLSLALIQPFGEGNKRTARLVQDRLLFDAGLPPAIIPAGEGRFYVSLLEKAAPSYGGHRTSCEEPFYNYVASKVNSGLDEIIGDLTPNVA